MKRIAEDSVEASGASPRGRGRYAALVGLIGGALLLSACSAAAVLRDAEPALPDGWSRFRFVNSPTNSVGAFGIFDASFARAGSAPNASIYMAYSVVSPSYRWPTAHPHVVQTRLAVSRDGGESFAGLPGRPNAAFDDPDHNLAQGLFGQIAPVTWQHEAPSLVYVPDAPASERWQLFWHQYPLIDGERRFEFGWIAHKAAAVPEELYAARATKLMVGGAYAATLADAYDGAPRIALNEVHGDLVGCVALTEPGAVVFQGRLFLVLHCADGKEPANGRIVLLQASGNSGATRIWNYRGTLLDNLRDAELLGGGASDFTGFGAPDLFQTEATGRMYLVVTPTRPGRHPVYRGCMVFTVLDLETAMLQRDGMTPRLAAVSNGDADLHNGACAYLDSDGLSSGLFQGQVFPDSVERFRLYRTEVRL
ncbi:MAG: exo-alpha-sialidase [Leptospirales bacterium]